MCMRSAPVLLSLSQLILFEAACAFVVLSGFLIFSLDILDVKSRLPMLSLVSNAEANYHHDERNCILLITTNQQKGHVQLHSVK